MKEHHLARAVAWGYQASRGGVVVPASGLEILKGESYIVFSSTKLIHRESSEYAQARDDTFRVVL